MRLARRVLLLSLVVILVLVAYRLGLHEYARPDPLRELFLSLGTLGPVVYVLSFSIWQTCMLPSAPFLLGGAVTWPLPIAFVTTWVGTVCAGIPAFLLSRYVAHDWVQEHLPARARRFDALITRHGIRSVVLLRLVFFTSAMLHPALALSRIRFYEFIVGSAIGLLPGVFMWVVFGPRAVTWMIAQPPSTWAATIAIGATATVIGLWLRKRYRGRPVAVAPVPDSVG